MSGKGLLIAAVLLAVLAGGVYWSRRAEEANKDKPSPDASPKLGAVADADAQRFEIRKKDAPPTVVEKSKDDKWQITAPEPLAADQDSAGGVVSTLSSLTWDQLVDEKGDPAQYGLNAPALQVEIDGKNGKKQTLLVGDETPTSGSFYAKLAGDPRVFTITSSTKGSVDKTPRDLRDKRLLTFSEDKLSRVELTAKGQTLELGKNAQGDWQILKPRPLRADGGQVDQVMQKLRDAKMDTSVSAEDEKKAPAAFASGTRVALARVTDASGSPQIEIRKKGNDYYAHSSAVPGTFKIASDVAQGLDKGLNDLRNKKLFDFGFNDPNRVDIRDGDKTYTFEKSGENWRSNGKQMDSTSVQILIDKLRDLVATSFPEFGFTTSVMDITVVSNSGKRTEKVSIAKTAKDYIARRENEPSLYAIEAKSIDEIRKAAADVKEAQPAKAPAKK